MNENEAQISSEDLEDPRSLVNLLIMGEILTRRGEDGPLARVWGRSSRRPPLHPDELETRKSGGGG